MNVSARGTTLHRRAIVVDLHADTLLWMRHLRYRFDRRHRVALPASPLFNHIDLPRLRGSGVTAIGFGLVVNPLRGKGCVAETDRLIDLFEATVAAHAADLSFVRSGRDIREAKKVGKTGIFLGIEGGHALAGDLENLDHFYDRGVRYLTIAHFTSNALGHPLSRRSRRDHGLTPLGCAAVERMNALGMLIDVAHLNLRGIEDVLSLTKAPVIASHTALSSVHPLPWRNLPDEQVRGIADSGGVVGIIFHPLYLCGRLCAPLEAVARHIERAIEVAGEDHVALGSDFDGFITLPKGLRDIEELCHLTDLLLRRGLSERTVEKVIGGNVTRVFEEVVSG